MTTMNCRESNGSSKPLHSLRRAGGVDPDRASFDPARSRLLGGTEHRSGPRGVAARELEADDWNGRLPAPWGAGGIGGRGGRRRGSYRYRGHVAGFAGPATSGAGGGSRRRPARALWRRLGALRRTGCSTPTRFCDVSIPEGEEGACPTECHGFDDCHPLKLRAQTCWSACVRDVPDPELCGG